jgi:RNA polymerase sigma-70 factor (ECF subfamily)
VCEPITTQDAVLLKRAILQKDRKALSLLYTRYCAPLKRYIASRVHSSDQAEDLAQKVFVELYTRDHKPHHGWHNAEAYLFGIARNLIREHHRSTKKGPKPLDAPTIEAIAARCHPIHQAAAPGESDDTQDLILKALSSLTPNARQALKLAIIDDLPPDQAARKARCSVVAFYQRLSRARKALAQLCKYQEERKK